MTDEKATIWGVLVSSSPHFPLTWLLEGKPATLPCCYFQEMSPLAARYEYGSLISYVLSSIKDPPKLPPVMTAKLHSNSALVYRNHDGPVLLPPSSLPRVTKAKTKCMGPTWAGIFPDPFRPLGCLPQGPILDWLSACGQPSLQDTGEGAITGQQYKGRWSSHSPTQDWRCHSLDPMSQPAHQRNATFRRKFTLLRTTDSIF